MLLDVTTGVVARLLCTKSRRTGIFNMLEPGFGDSVVTEVRRLHTKAETMRNALIDPEVTTISVVLIPEKAAVLGERAAYQDRRGPRRIRRFDHRYY